MIVTAYINEIIRRKEYFEGVRDQGIAQGDLAKVPEDYEVLLREIKELQTTLKHIRDLLGCDC